MKYLTGFIMILAMLCSLQAAPGDLIYTFEGHSAPVFCVRFTPDGQYAISVAGGDNKGRVWDLTTKQCIWEMEEIL